jgi:hypothetical protein
MLKDSAQLVQSFEAGDVFFGFWSHGGRDLILIISAGRDSALAVKAVSAGSTVKDVFYEALYLRQKL